MLDSKRKLVAVALLLGLACCAAQESIAETEDADYGEADNDSSDADSKSKFHMGLHQDDHGVYAGRSLMSAIEQPQPENEPQDSGDLDESGVLNTTDYAESEWQLMFRSLDLMYDSSSSSMLAVLAKHTNIVDRVVANIQSPKCARDIQHTRDSMKRHKLWALRMLDSIGKIPSGITYGRFASQGDFEECIGVDVDELVYKRRPNATSTEDADDESLLAERFKFKGKYCLFDFRLPMPERPKDKILSIHDPVIDLKNTEMGRRFPEIANYSGYASVLYEIGYMHAFCVPNSCEMEDMRRALGKTLEGIHLLVHNVVDCQEADAEPVRSSQVVCIVLLALVFLNTAYATIAYERRQRRQLDNTRKRRKHDAETNELALARHTLEKLEQTLDYGAPPSATRSAPRGGWLANTALVRALRSKFHVDCFSIQTNFHRLSKSDPRGLTFVHYTRIVAMALTVVTHTGAMGTLQAITKPADASNSEAIFRDFLPQMLANAFSSIQIFFFMAGFMLVISTFPSIKRDNGKLDFAEYAVKRAIRLLPGIFAALCLNFLWPLVVNGPMVSYFIRVIVEPCETNWWRTMAFLSNFDHVEKMCLRHSYFSASDYQLHIAAFPLLILLYKSPIMSLYIAGLLTLTGFMMQVIMIMTKNVLPFMMVDYLDKEAFFNVIHYIHHPVWNHMSAFFYGFIIGYFVVQQIRVSLRPQTIRTIWLVIMPLGLAAIFAPYFWNHYKRPIYRWQMVLYVIIDRFLVLTMCAWLSYATMVLMRPPPKDERSQVGREKPVPTPTEASTPMAPSKEGESVFVSVPLWPTTQNKPNSETQNLALPIADSPLTRQKSSPDMRVDSLKSPIDGLNLRASNSTSNLAALSTTALEEQPEPPPRKRAPRVSNMNTLCLILSRLTFQLYLFNMVVLWIDVQHSKYNWYFSYYFIMTKSLAVYICSALLATIFFVTLESPCLTLYIAWVKSRALQRSKAKMEREAAVANEAHVAPTYDDTGDSPREARLTPIPRPLSAHLRTNTSVSSLEGLVLRAKPPKASRNHHRQTQAGFNLISLSSGSPPSPRQDPHHQLQTASSDTTTSSTLSQTRM